MVDDIRTIFEDALKEHDPEKKLDYIEQAVDEVEDHILNNPTSRQKVTLENICEIYIKKIIFSLSDINMKRMSLKTRQKYVLFFRDRVFNITNEIISNDMECKENFDDFCNKYDVIVNNPLFECFGINGISYTDWS